MSYEIAVFVLCLAISGFFSGSETALLSAGRIRLTRLAADGDARAAKVLETVADPRRLLAGILVGNNLVNVLAAVVAGAFCARLVRDESVAAALATVVATPLLVLFSEFLPKTLATVNPVRASRLVVAPIRASLVLLTPFVLPLEALSRPLGSILSQRRQGFGLAELRIAIAESVQHGTLDASTAGVVRRGLSLQRKSVGDVIIPRVDVIGVDVGASHEQCLEIFRRERFSRLLVMDGTPDRDCGYVALKDIAILDPSERERWTAGDGAREAIRVLPTLSLNDLLGQMRSSGVHFAVVKDEYGGTAGIVTLEDVLEELVGEIRDEHDPEELPTLEKESDDVWLVRGDVSLHELNDAVNTAIRSVRARTVAGFLAESLHRVPRVGDRVDAEGATLSVERMSGRRVVLVRLARRRGPRLSGPAGPA